MSAVGHLGWRPRPRLAAPQVDAAPREALAGVRRSSLGARLTYLLIVLYALTFAGLSALQHDAFRTHAFDLGNFDQALWNTSQGRWFEFTNWSGGTTRLAAHVEPILIPIAGLYRLWSSPKTLLILQSVVIALGALPAFWLARAKLHNDFAGFAFAAAYLLAPELQAANLRDFHPVALAAAFLLFAFYWADRGNLIACLVCSVLAMATKEEIPLSVGLIGLYLVFARHHRAGWLICGLAAVWLIVALAVVLPTFNAGGGSPYMSRYNHLGDGPGGVLLALVTRPGEVLATVLVPPKIAYLQSLLGPVLFLSLLSPLTLAPGLPDLALNLLSNYEGMYRGGAHYSAPIIPFVIISAIFATRRLAHGGGWLAALVFGYRHRASAKLGIVCALSGLILLVSLKSYWDVTLRPLSDDFPAVTEHERIGTEILTLIPPEASVATSSGINPHLSQRRQIGLFPEFDQANYVALDVTADPYPIDAPSQWWRVQELLAGGQWGVLAARDGFLILERGGARRDLPSEFFTFTRVDPPLIGQPRTVIFDQAVEFLGFDLKPGPTVHGRDPRARLALYFRALQPLRDDYRVSVSITDPAGALSGELLYHPATIWLPTSRWEPGATYRIDVPGVSPYGLPEALIWLALERGSPDQPARAPFQAEPTATIDPARQSVFLTPLRSG